METIIKKKWIFAIMLYLPLFVSAYDFEADGLFYNINPDKTSVEVTYRNTNYDTYTGEVIIPSQVSYNGNTYTVIGIGRNAFTKCTTMTSITIPKTIKEIASFAFSDANHLQKIHISDLSSWCMINISNYYSSPLAYGGTLYLNNSPVTSLETLDASCTTIAKYAFLSNKYLTNVILPESIMSVQEGAFRGCSNMCYLEVGSNVTSMGTGVFISCSSLNTINFKDSEQTLELDIYQQSRIYSYFKDCPLTNVYIGRNIEWKDDGQNHEYYFPFTTIKSATFNVSNASDRGFSNSLRTVYVGANCKSIYIRSTNLTNLFIFTNDITSAYLGGRKSNIFVIDKTNIPEIISELTYQRIENLVNIKDLQNGASYIYGSLPVIDSNNFDNNVLDMTLYTPASLNSSVGYYDTGIPLILSNNWWDISFNIPYSYKIHPAPLTIIANDTSKKYGMENPDFTCSFFGFKNGETKEILDRLPTVETTATISSNVGSYPIIPSGAEAQNYTFNYERGTLTITKADQEIEWEQQLETANVGDVIELTAISSSKLPIKYTSTDEAIAEIYTQKGGKFVEFLKPGKVSIRAIQDGNENYNEADRISKSIDVLRLASSISLNKTSISAKIGSEHQLIATVLPNDASNKNVVWESSNERIATVNTDGLVKIIAKGECFITATTVDNSNISAKCEILVTSGIENTTIDDDSSLITTKDGTIIIPNKGAMDIVRIFSIQGVLITETNDKIIKNLSSGLYIVSIGTKTYKVKL